MAALDVTPEGLGVRLGRWERFATFQRDFSVPWAHVDAAYPVRDLWPQVLGWRWPGIGIPHVILVGRMVYRDGRDFCAIFRDRPGLIVELSDQPYRRLLFSAPATTVTAVIERVTRG